MQQPRSIRSQLSLVFFFFFLLVLVLGVFSLSRLSSFNRQSADVAEVWLPTVRTLGDLNNFTSDFRAIEGGNLLAADPAEIAATESEMERLDRAIARAERSFKAVRHDETENVLYAKLEDRWNEYRRIVNQILQLSRTGRKDEARALYTTASRAAYNAASDTLGQLTDRAAANAHAASDRLAFAYRHAFWLVVLAIVLAGAVVTGALIYIGRAISAPLLQLADQMRRLAVNDTGTAIAGAERRDEIGEMARAAVVFRNNSIELMRSRRVLAQQAAQLEKQLELEQNLALRQRNFVSMASHEFRTPLTIIDAHAQRFINAKGGLSNEQINERAGNIRRAVRRMTHLIDNLLNSSRLVDGGAGFYLQPAGMDLVALLREVCQFHREMAPGSELVERAGPGPLMIVGDPKALFQVFSNLVSNAVKYSPDGGSIEIGAEDVGDQAVVTVTDRGIGIPAADLDHVFDRYNRGSNVSGIVGTGLGLYLAKVVIELHGGSIGVESAENRGSCFTVRLPIKDARPQPKTARADVELIGPVLGR